MKSLFTGSRPQGMNDADDDFKGSCVMAVWFIFFKEIINCNVTNNNLNLERLLGYLSHNSNRLSSSSNLSIGALFCIC